LGKSAPVTLPSLLVAPGNQKKKTFKKQTSLPLLAHLQTAACILPFHLPLPRRALSRWLVIETVKKTKWEKTNKKRKISLPREKKVPGCPVTVFSTCDDKEAICKPNKNKKIGSCDFWSNFFFIVIRGSDPFVPDCTGCRGVVFRLPYFPFRLIFSSPPTRLDN
jgi:hypothetical protein